jgi:anti-sigma-28 factor FlgM
MEDVDQGAHAPRSPRAPWPAAQPSVDGQRKPVAAAAPPGDRADMVRELRESITDGSYTVDPSLVAEAMLVRMRREPASVVLVPPQSLDGDTVGAQQRDAAAGLDLA